AYLKRFPQSLDIHCLQTYTYKSVTRHNANRLLGSCPGVDGLKTGFVNASGYNLSATAMRDGRRLIAVVLGGTSPGVRNRETARLLEYGFTGAFPPAVTRVAKSGKGKSAAKSTAAANKNKGGKTTKSAAAANKSKSGKAATTAATAGKKLASKAGEKTKTSAKQAGAKEKKSSSTSTAKQTTAANKPDKQKEHSVQQQKQIKAESKAPVRKKIEKPSKEKKNTEPAKT
ncbi:MAG: hypothetical protein HXY23_15255, partial [Parvularculaceae bacterium]|nr:hypothetical protein [Parvularculaceae bacterium]